MNQKIWYRHLIVLALFTAITPLMTYPAVFQWTHSIIGDHADSLFNAWILAWDVHKITAGELLSLFNANIFYPHTNTLAYSEHMLGSSLWALPIMVISKNPVLTYNIVFLVGLILSAFGMYLLVFDLTENRYAAVTAGLIFGFFPWRFAHAAHIQLQMAQWIPLTFLYLHRFFRNRSYKNVFLFTLFFIMQFMSCGYYGVYLTFFVCLMIFLTLWQRDIPVRLLVLPLGLSAAVSALCIFPIYYPYIKVKQEMGFSRHLNEVIYYSPDLLSYLNTTIINRVWGKPTQIFWRPEGELFLGVTTIFLGITGMFAVVRRKESSAPKHVQIRRKGRFLRFSNNFIGFFFIFYVVVVLFVFITGGISTTVFGLKVSATDLERPLLIMIILGGFKLLIERAIQGRFRTLGLFFTSSIPRFYFWVLLLSFVFSLGPIIHSHGQAIFQYGPYGFLHQYFPGFEGLRAPSRFVIMVVFSLCVLAGFGLNTMLAKIKRAKAKVLITVIASLLILFEYASVPIKMAPIPTGKNIPLVYQWLSKQKGEFPILELPLPNIPEEVWRETIRVYYSTYHWKKLVNGYSGYFPPDYDFLYQKGIKGFPSEDSVGLLQKLGIKYLIIHFDEYENQDQERIKGLLKNYQGPIRPVIHFENDFVYKFAEEG
jgi:hypothetical protein